ncbi:TIR domain-containing protein [Nocardia sp. NPDC003354]
MTADLEAGLTQPRQAAFDYDAFISYTHRDRPVAAGIQRGLHRIGRRVGRLRALRVFRDSTDLTASPDLWGKVTAAMDRARYLIVVLSPQAAASRWVDREVAHWLTVHGPDRLMFVLADGQLRWDEATARFDPDHSDAALPVLTRPGALPTEPFYVDVGDDAPWDPTEPLFREKITDLAAPIHGKDKAELAGEDVRELRRFRRLRRAAVAGLVVLTVLALLAASIAFVQRREAENQRNEAIRQRDTAIGLRLAGDAESMLNGSKSRDDERAIMQALASERLAPGADPGVLIRTLKQLSNTDRIIRVGKPYLSGLTIQPEGGIDPMRIGVVWSAAISPDGRRMVTGGSRVQLWDTETGQPIGDSFPNLLSVTSVAFSPDGRKIVAGGLGMQLWDAESRTRIGTFDGHRGMVRSVGFSADGSRVVSGGADKTVRIWDATTRQQVGASMSEHTGHVLGVAFSPDGRRIVSGSGDESVRIWDAQRQTAIGGPLAIGDTVNSVAFSPDNRQVAVTAQSGVRLFDPDSGTVGDPLPADGHDTGMAVTFSTDGRRLAAGGIGAVVHLWDTETRASRGYATGHTGWVMSVAFSRDDARLVSSSLDGTVRIWHTDTHASGGHRITGPNIGAGLPVPSSVAFAPDSRRMVAGYRDGSLWQFETDTGRPVGTPMRGHTGPVEVTAVSADGRWIASGGTDRTVVVWDAASGARDRTLSGHRARIRALAFSPDGGRLISESGDGAVRLWDLAGGGADGVPLPGSAGGIMSPVFSPDGRVVAAGGADKLVHLWDTATGGHLAGLTGHESEVTSVGFSGDGATIVSLSQFSVRMWDARNYEQLSSPVTGPDVSGSLTVSPVGDFAVVGGSKALRRWSIPTGTPIGTAMQGHSNLIGGVAVTADGRIIVSGSKDRTLRFWDAATGMAIGDPLVSGEDDVARVALSADGRRILALHIEPGDYVSAWLWPGPTAWHDDLCGKVSQNMSHAQWRDWISKDIDYIQVCDQLPVPPDNTG